MITYAGYILGFPNDTIKSIMHDIDVIKRELPIDLLEFFVLTPLPGSEDHLKLHKAGATLDPDMNKYDFNHVCAAHPKMSRQEWEKAYALAWQRYYTTEHIETILRRVASARANASNALFLITWFKGAVDIEGIHPLEVGFLRRKSRRDRRPGLPIEPRLLFYPKYAVETVVKLARWGTLYMRLRRHLLGDQARPAPVRLYRPGDDAGGRRRGGHARTVRYRCRARLCGAGKAHQAGAGRPRPQPRLRRRRRSSYRRTRASSACARARCGRSYILPSMPTVPAPGLAAKAATIALAFSICSGARREHLVDHRHLRRMDGEPPGKAVAARDLGVAAQDLRVAEIHMDGLDRRHFGRRRAEQAHGARDAIGLGERAVGLAVGFGAELGRQVLRPPGHADQPRAAILDRCRR